QQPPQSVHSPYTRGYPAATPPPYDPYTAGGYTPPPPELPPPALTPVPPQVDPLPAAPAEPKESGKPPPMKPPKDIFASKSKKSAKTSPGGGCSFFIKILPLGAGQFCQGSVFKGVLFAGAQVGGLYFYKQNSDAATKFTGQVANLKSQREAGRENYSGDEQIAYDAETDQKVKEGNAAASKASNNATMSLAVFGGAWAIGIIDAVAFGPGKSKRTVKKARLSLLLPTRGDPETTFALVSYLPSYKPDSWYMGYSIDHQHPERNLGSLKLGVSWEL
ncbi:MAG: hypothetical protein NTV34_20400, partial [Proteobacteria bacterium]|nr:hypothetical protein [Pseudomonadota bacterium]